MQKSAIAVLTYNRQSVLDIELNGLSKHCKQYPTAVFEDCGYADGTRGFLKMGHDSTPPKWRPDLMADEYPSLYGRSNCKVFLGARNLGVSGNSNRALKWLVDETDADHFCLVNDDLEVHGDFVDFYRKAHMDLGVGMLNFCDFTGPTYRWVDIKKRGFHVKLCPRMTGIMMSFTREMINAIGYFDMSFGKFGEEHSDFTVRARLAGYISLDGTMQQQIDVHHHMVGEPKVELIKHQECETSVTGVVRKQADAAAAVAMRAASEGYRHRHLYRPFCLSLPKYVGGTKSAGIPVDGLAPHGTIVTDFWPQPLRR
jgi:GT2 family glycosyltransferase